MTTIPFGRMRLLALACGILALAALTVFADDAPQFSAWSAAVKLPSPINGPAPTQDGCPFIAKNNLDLYFRSDRPGGYGGFDIYVSHRETVEDPWEDPINLGPEVNTAYGEFCSFVTTDGHWLYFVSDRPVGGCGSQDIWVSHRKDKRNDTGWEAPKNLGCAVNSTAWDNGPSLFEDEATGESFLYFSSSRQGGLYDIYVSKMLSDDHETFLPPTLVPELNTGQNDMQPSIRRKDGLEIIFASNRTGSLSAYLDLWSSTRPDTSSPWSTPVNLGPLVNSAGREYRPSLSWDGTTLYFWTDRNTPTDAMDIYMATRTKLRD